MANRPSITIVGPGSLGSALARSLYEAGFKIVNVVYRSSGSARRARVLAKEVGATAVSFDEAWTQDLGSVGSPRRRAVAVPTLVWLCVGDAAIHPVASELEQRTSWRGVVVFHSSGALSSYELRSLRAKGAAVASVHPMMTFVRSSAASMKGVPFALEGDRRAVQIARKVVDALGGTSFVIAKKDKPLYHALGAFVSPLIVSQMAAVEKIGRELGLKPEKTRSIVAPILQQTVRNYLNHGPAAAFSGPIVRGDASTVRKNLAALRMVRGASEIYRALAKMATEELPSKDARAIREAIE